MMNLRKQCLASVQQTQRVPRWNVRKASSFTVESNIDLKSGLTSQDLKAQIPNLDPHGQKIVSSAQGVIDATNRLMNEKNIEERYQRLIQWSKGTAVAAAGAAPSAELTKAAQNLMAEATGIGAKIADDATDVLAYIRQTVMNLTTSAEFRKLTVEYLEFFQAMLGEVKDAAKDGDAKALEQVGEKIKSRVYEDAEERYEAIHDKLSTLLDHVAKNPEYKKVVNNFMKYSEEIYNSLYNAKEHLQSSKESEELRKTWKEAIEMLNDFAGKDVVSKWENSLCDLQKQISKDQDLTSWAKECRQLITDSMEHPDHLEKNAEKVKKMIQKGTDVSGKYRKYLNAAYSDATKIFQKIASDPVVKNFQQQLEELGRNIALNNKGQVDLFVLENSMSTIKNLLIERFRTVLADVPITRVQLHSDSLDLLLTNITIEGTGFVPNHINARFTTETDLNLTRSPDAEQFFEICLRLDQIKPHFKHVDFSYVRKTFPEMRDKGVASIIFEGNGLSADVVLQFRTGTDNISRAEVTRCTVKLDKVNLTIERAQHQILDSLLAPIIQATLRTRLEAGIQEYVQKNLNLTVDQLNDWFATRPFETLMKEGNETLQDAVEAGKQTVQKTAQQLRDAKSTIDNSLPWTSSGDNKSGDNKSGENKSGDNNKSGENNKQQQYGSQSEQNKSKPQGR